MYRGRSPEEIELASEECGIWGGLRKGLSKAGTGALKALKTPAGTAAAVSLLVSPASAAAVTAAMHKSQPRREIASPPTTPTPPKETGIPEAEISGWDMGAEPPMSDAEVMRLIRREGNPFKQMRMLANFHRTRRSR